jgi:hypothetical protein
MTQAPVHMSHGLKVVYMVAPRYADAGRRPAISSVDISAFLGQIYNGVCETEAVHTWSVALSFWMRILWP